MWDYKNPFAVIGCHGASSAHFHFAAGLERISEVTGGPRRQALMTAYHGAFSF